MVTKELLSAARLLRGVALVAIGAGGVAFGSRALVDRYALMGAASIAAGAAFFAEGVGNIADRDAVIEMARNMLFIACIPLAVAVARNPNPHTGGTMSGGTRPLMFGATIVLTSAAIAWWIALIGSRQETGDGSAHCIRRRVYRVRSRVPSGQWRHTGRCGEYRVGNSTYCHSRSENRTAHYREPHSTYSHLGDQSNPRSRRPAKTEAHVRRELRVRKEPGSVNPDERDIIITRKHVAVILPSLTLTLAALLAVTALSADLKNNGGATLGAWLIWLFFAIYLMYRMYTWLESKLVVTNERILAHHRRPTSASLWVGVHQ